MLGRNVSESESKHNAQSLASGRRIERLRKKGGGELAQNELRAIASTRPSRSLIALSLRPGPTNQVEDGEFAGMLSPAINFAFGSDAGTAADRAPPLSGSECKPWSKTRIHERPIHLFRAERTYPLLRVSLNPARLSSSTSTTAFVDEKDYYCDYSDARNSFPNHSSDIS